MRNPVMQPCALAVVACAMAMTPISMPLHAQSVPPAATPAPRLIVHFTVDQLRPDYLTRFGDQLTGGLARLMKGGAVFTQAYQDHAITETAPGHASTLSGRFPRSTHIVQNTIGVEDTAHALVQARGPGASPFRFRGTTLTDWLTSHDPRTRALSISRKDRGAILPIGRGKQTVIWYAPLSGMFTTSTWYADTLPTWVAAFNARRLPQSYAGRAWTPLLPANAYAEPDSVPLESHGNDYLFPHVLPDDSANAAAILPNFPWMDDVTLAGAMQGLEAMRLGTGPATDLLAVSLSSTDAVGHKYGSESRELHDHILRLDRALGAFIDSLYKVRDSTTIVISLTADHGVTPYPGIASRDRPPGAIVVTAAWDTLVAVTQRVRALGVDSTGFLVDPPFVQADAKALAKHGIAKDSLIRALQRSLRAVPGVMRAETMAEVARHDTTTDAIARRWLHMFPADFPVALTITLQPYDYWFSGSTTHGTPHDLDAHVPLILYGPGVKAGRYTGMVRVVDLAPTLAAIAHVTPTERLDGRVLRQAIR